MKTKFEGLFEELKICKYCSLAAVYFVGYEAMFWTGYWSSDKIYGLSMILLSVLAFSLFVRVTCLAVSLQTKGDTHGN